MLRTMRSISAPTATSFAMFAAGEPYPFDEIQSRSEEESDLRAWLLRLQHDVGLGGAALVTGFRGVGKTSLVNKVLFDVGMATLHGVGFVDPEGATRTTAATAPQVQRSKPPRKPVWGPFDAESRASFAKVPESIPALVLPVRVDIAGPITPTALMRRIVRAMYFTMVDHRIGALDPRLVQRARGAYLRTLGEMSVETVERVKASFGIDLKQLARLPLEVGMEAELAQTIRQVVGQLSIEEAEEEILDVAAGTAAPLGARTFWSDLETLGNKKVQQLLSEALSKVKDRAGVRVHPVLVLDELDKLDGVGAGDDEVSAIGAGEPLLTTSHAIVRLLKTLFSSRHLHVVAIGGWRLEDAWLAEQSTPDPILRSLFSRHVYVRAARPQDLAPLVAGSKPFLTEYVALRTRGRYKDAIRVATELEREHHDVLREKLGPRLEGWGTFDVAKLDGSESPTSILEHAKTLEDLVRGLSAALPPMRANRFGVDYVRAVLAGCVLEFASGHSDAPTPGTLEYLSARAGEVARDEAQRVPSAFLRQALLALIGWLHPSAAGDATHPSGE